MNRLQHLPQLYNLLYAQAVIPAPVIEYGVNSVPESPRLAQLPLYSGDSSIKPE